MFTVGLTGGIGSGKSTVADIFSKEHGIHVVDADVIAREVLLQHQAQVIEHFGAGCLDADGQINRAALREHIFQHPEDRAWLEALLHPHIRQALQEQTANAPSPYVIAMIPLLAHTRDAHDYLDRVLLVHADEKTRLARIQLRDGIDETLAKQMLASQADDAAYRAIADDVIENVGESAALLETVNTLHKLYLSSRA
ncbi:MAG: dephospho-CoA kinase [marine bacterium B5-7]|nr:MAG: dephospho-CoA kinase [marine bacterium B5-7]